jgi:GntR family transcriptional repressor for pyruvate dehydrogenase complex
LPKKRASILPEAWEALETIECRIVELASIRRTEEDIDAIEQATIEMDEALETEEFAVEEDERFHLTFAHASHNRILVQVMHGLIELVGTPMEHPLGEPDRRGTGN